MITRLRILIGLALGLLLGSGATQAQQQPQSEFDIEPLTPNSQLVLNLTNGFTTATGGVQVRYGGAVLTAERATVDPSSHEVDAEGNVRVQQGEQIWVGDRIRYNFNTHQIEARQFRSGQPPLFATGLGLRGELTNQVYFATNAVVTADDVAKPLLKLRATRIKIIPGKKIEAYNATLYAGEVPVFYFPYYTRSLETHANHFNFTPGDSSTYGAFVLGTYTWYWGDDFDGVIHADYRSKRGPGVGPDINYRLGSWGNGTLKYYYTHDQDPNIDQLGVPISEDRQRVWFSYEANPATNLAIKSMIRYQSDLAMVRDFFPAEYRKDSQPNSFLEVNKFWENFSVDTYVEPQLNTFLQTVERLPEIKLTGYRQQLGTSPLYYESVSSAGYYRQMYAVNSGIYGAPPGTNYGAGRADTFQQLFLPETFFGWLNVTPRVGGRLTYYSEATGPYASTNEQYRSVFNTGAEISFKASRVWPGIQSPALEVNGLRHIIEPSANYVFVPSPSAAPSQLPQFDTELPSLRLLPITYPDYNSIDSIDSQNVIRWGLHNKLQTKRGEQIANLVNWDVYTDWRLTPQPGQTTFADLYSDLTLRPRSWLSLESLLRYNPSSNQWRMSYTTLTIQPNSVWSWRFGHYYLRDDFGPPTATALGPGNNVLNSAIYYRLNEDWGFRMSHYYNLQTGKFQEQAYSIYHDLRSWTAAISFLARDNTTGSVDYGVAFTFSLKAYPRFGLGADTGGPYSLLGG